jgi:hypothetical protein
MFMVEPQPNNIRNYGSEALILCIIVRTVNKEYGIHKYWFPECKILEGDNEVLLVSPIFVILISFYSGNIF